VNKIRLTSRIERTNFLSTCKFYQMATSHYSVIGIRYKVPPPTLNELLHRWPRREELLFFCKASLLFAPGNALIDLKLQTSIIKTGLLIPSQVGRKLQSESLVIRPARGVRGDPRGLGSSFINPTKQVKAIVNSAVCAIL
jgi:hypothetical protein